MKDYKNNYGEWALITGASSGMGEIFSRKLAAAGMNVVLVARRKEKLIMLSDELTTKYKIETRVITADLSNEIEAKSVVAACDDLEVGMLINTLPICRFEARQSNALR